MLELFTAEKGKKAKLEAEKKEGHVAGGGEGRGENTLKLKNRCSAVWTNSGPVNTEKNYSSSFGRLLRNNNTILPRMTTTTTTVTTTTTPTKVSCREEEDDL